MNPWARPQRRPFMEVLAVVEELAALQEQLRFRLEHHRLWVRRVVDILNVVGAAPVLKLYGKQYEWIEAVPPPRWTLGSAPDWARFLEYATLDDYRELEPALRMVWRQAQLSRPLPELPELGEALRAAFPPSPRFDKLSTLDLATTIAPRASETEPVVREDVERHVARVRRAMVLALIENPNADLVSPGACGLVANKAGVGAKTMTNWFSGSGFTLTKLVRRLLDEASAEATQERAAQKLN